MAKQPPCPTESIEQQAIIKWALWSEAAHPELKLLYHVPNEGRRTRSAGARLKSEGLRPGVPDLCLPVPRGPYHGLYVELKRVRGTTPSDAQKEWLLALHAQGYCTTWCRGADQAIDIIKWYLSMPAPPPPKIPPEWQINVL